MLWGDDVPVRRSNFSTSHMMHTLAPAEEWHPSSAVKKPAVLGTPLPLLQPGRANLTGCHAYLGNQLG